MYEWRDAKSKFFYKKFNNSNFISYTFTECKRSSQVIVNTYCLLRKKSESNLQSTVKREELPISIYRFAENKEHDIIAKWKNEIDKKHKKNHVLVRGNALKNKLLGKSNGKIEPWKSMLPYKVLSSQQDFNNKDIKKAVSTFRKVIPTIEGIDDYYEKKERESEIKKDHVMNGKIVEILKQLPLFDLSLKEWTEEVEKLIKKYFPKSNIKLGLKVGIWNKQHEINMNDIFSIAETTLNIEVSTIHGIKGKTFDSILLFLSKKHSQAISIEDIIATETELNERQRMIYVAMSRPRHLLSIAIPDHYSKEEIKTKIGNNVNFK